MAKSEQGSSGVEVNYNNTISARPLNDGTGGSMFIEIVPYYRGYWIIHAETIWRTPDNIWTYFHWGVRLTDGGGAHTAKPDLNGAYDFRMHVSVHLLQYWQESCLSTVFKLEKDTLYRCLMWWPNSSFGYNQAIFAGDAYHHIQGEFVEDGSL